MKSLIFLLLAALPAAAQAAWTPRASFPAGATSAAGDVIAGRLVIAGGYTTIGFALDLGSRTNVYDPLSDSWTRAGDLPETKAAMGSCVFNGRLYAIGGNVSATTATNTVFSYDPAARTWRAEPPLAVVRPNHAVAVFDGKIYAIGGLIAATGMPTTTVQVFDGTAWTDEPALQAPVPVAGNFAEALNGAIYMGGGVDGYGSLEFYRFDPQVPSWTRMADLPNLIVGASSAARGNRLYVLGGADFFWGTTAANVYDALTDSWAPLPALLTPRWFTIAGRIGRNLHITSGTTPFYQLSLAHEDLDLGVVGHPPAEPINISLAHGDGSPLKFGGYDALGSIRVRAELSDPDTDPVSLEVKYWPIGSPEPPDACDATPEGPGGPFELPVTGLPDGLYALACRSMDFEGNPSKWVYAGGTSDVDAAISIAFIIDGMPPLAPQLVTPLLERSTSRDVRIAWIAASDLHGPLTYHVRFPGGEVSTPGLSTHQAVPLGINRIQVRAEDPAGNLSPWSNVGIYERDDGIDNGGGDGCGFSATGSAWPLALMVLIYSLLIFTPASKRPVGVG